MNSQTITFNDPRYYVSFVNPRNGEDDRMWFTTFSARRQWVNDFRSDFPCGRILRQWHTSDISL